MDLTAPSKLNLTLDTFQTLFIILVGLSRSPLLKRFSIFHGVLMLLPSHLGLHLECPFETLNEALERRLAYRGIVYLDAMGTWKMGGPLFKLSSYCFDSTISKRTLDEYRRRILNEDGLRDYCILVVNESLFKSSCIFLEINQIHLASLRKRLPSQWLMSSVTNAIKALELSSSEGFASLYGLSQSFCFPVTQLNSPFLPFSIGTSPRSFIDHALLYFQIRYELSKLLILKACSQADPNHPTSHLSEKPLKTMTHNNEKALVCADNLIRLLHQTTPRLFLFNQLSMISMASTFMMQHYHSYIASNRTSVDLTASLCQVQSLLSSLITCPKSGYVARSIFCIFKGLLVRHKIILPTEKTLEIN
ncbi:hypothetical protein DSO57_1002579 [Entomophthora muscae]|uniref:Uncharacterized protein n=1 Tax=Entomophthora muscae TaxID=34485 RepID=A0ACC2U737_9FUNG|nr:hypothetical protein DSO57_1002579 [Entomophthora muscae]